MSLIDIPTKMPVELVQVLDRVAELCGVDRNTVINMILTQRIHKDYDAPSTPTI